MPKLPPEHPPIRPVSMDDTRSGWWDTARWVGAGAIVLCAHAAGAYAVHSMQSEDVMDGTPPAAIMIEFAPEPEAPVAEEEAEAIQPETAEEVAEAEPEPELEPEPEVAPEPEPEPEPQPEPEPEPEEVIPDIVEAPTPEVAVPLPVKKPVERPKPVEKKQEKPIVKRVEKPKPKQAEKAPVAKKSATPAVAANDGSKLAANRNGQSAGNPGISSDKWVSKLQAHLERQRRFLSRGMGSGAKGIVNISFVIDPSGQVLSARVSGSSGDVKLDQLALQTVQRASPVPAPPAAMAKSRMPITVPIRFTGRS
ncbi:protein TonB [Paenochrobactrum gallinarii]|uniref:Protein TonB n=1 Tax=Paenochrobactrum gallinarii TaxID=643673 RepID=A0A841LWI9_9HYPH|nr:energy transducer TonB [Paenochrobactrum gallinarii]MBB6261240.1 protein TonB [Paenochrobactrum gallinarii]